MAPASCLSTGFLISWSGKWSYNDFTNKWMFWTTVIFDRAHLAYTLHWMFTCKNCQFPMKGHTRERIRFKQREMLSRFFIFDEMLRTHSTLKQKVFHDDKIWLVSNYWTMVHLRYPSRFSYIMIYMAHIWNAIRYNYIILTRTYENWLQLRVQFASEAGWLMNVAVTWICYRIWPWPKTFKWAFTIILHRFTTKYNKSIHKWRRKQSHQVIEFEQVDLLKSDSLIRMDMS